MDLWAQWGKERVGQIERVALRVCVCVYIYIYTCVCVCVCIYIYIHTHTYTAAAAAKSLQSCLTLCDPIDGSPMCKTDS